MSYHDELERTADRLRQLSGARLSGQADRFADLLAAMTERSVPRIEPYAWGDQLLVIGQDVDPERAAQLVDRLVAFRRGLDLTPGG